MTPFELQERALRILVRELGYADAMRFMLQFRSGKGDYTKDRRKLFASVSDEDLLALSRQYTEREMKPKKKRRKSA